MTEMQHGANRAIIPATTAATTEPPKKMLLFTCSPFPLRHSIVHSSETRCVDINGSRVRIATSYLPAGGLGVLKADAV